MARVACLASAAAFACPTAAHAEDRSAEMPKFPATVDEVAAPRLPPPFVMPELSHKSWDASASWLVGVADAHRTDQPSAALGLARLAVEGDAIFPRRMYIGALLPFAAALSPDGTSGTKTVLGNVEAHVRVAFPLPSLIAFGAVLGVVAPTERYERNTGAHSAAMVATSLEPTDAVLFEPDAFALRPAVDMRVLRGPFIFQARQGMDIVVDTKGGRAVTTGRFLGHIGIRVKPDVELSVELTQSYLFDERVSDDRRTAITLGPGARLSLGSVDVGAQVISSLFEPLSPELDRFVALRLSLIAHME